MKMFPLIISFVVSLPGYARQKIDLLVYNAVVYTVDKNFSRQEALAINGGKILPQVQQKIVEKNMMQKKKAMPRENIFIRAW